jgi:hypothetical protein
MIDAWAGHRVRAVLCRSVSARTRQWLLSSQFFFVFVNKPTNNVVKRVARLLSFVEFPPVLFTDLNGLTVTGHIDHLRSIG